MRPKSALLLGALVLAGCGNKAEMPLYGKWEGRFQTQDAGTDLQGFIQLYATDHRYDLRLGNRNQNYDVTGSWQIKGHRIVCSVRNIAFDGFTKQQAEEHRVPYLSPDDARAAYGHTLVLDLSPDGRSLTGLEITLGGAVGRHVFQKVARSSY